jgi:hypothetical protein
VKNARRLLLGALPAFLAGCGSITYDVSKSRLYTSDGGYVPGHVYRLKTDAVVLALTDQPYPSFQQYERVWLMAEAPPPDPRNRRYLQRAAMPHPPIFKIVRRVPAGSRLRIDSLRHHLANFVTYENWIDVHGTILDGPRENSAFEIEGESDLSIARSGSFGLTPDIPMPNPKYLKDVNSMWPPRSAKRLESLNNESPWPNRQRSS